MKDTAVEMAKRLLVDSIWKSNSCKCSDYNQDGRSSVCDQYETRMAIPFG